MKKQSIWHFLLALQFILATATTACNKQPQNSPDTPGTETPGNGEAPFTPISTDLVGTWYDSNNESPMSGNWEEGSFQGETGFANHRTMVFTADGKSAIEYSSEVFLYNNKMLRQMYKITGTLEYTSGSSNKLVFHAVSGRIRVFEGESYTESDVKASDLAKYYSVLTDLVAAPTVLNAKRNDGANSWSVKYLKVSGTGGGGNQPPVGSPYSQPPASGSYVQINSQYFPTVTLGNREWMAVNYYGSGGINLDGKVSYGTFYRFTDLDKIPVPAGWRLPIREDYISLLESQGIVFDRVFNSTDGADVSTKKKLGQLMSVAGWLKQDGYETNAAGFNAVPANVQVTSGTAYGEGFNCVLWTGERDSIDNYIAFKIIQMPSDTYAAFASYPEGFNPVYAPVRLVRDK